MSAVPGLFGGLAACDGGVMPLLLCDEVVYTARELDFLFKIGWVAIETLLNCVISWLD